MHDVSSLQNAIVHPILAVFTQPIVTAHGTSPPRRTNARIRDKRVGAPGQHPAGWQPNSALAAEPDRSRRGSGPISTTGTAAPRRTLQSPVAQVGDAGAPVAGGEDRGAQGHQVPRGVGVVSGALQA